MLWPFIVGGAALFGIYEVTHRSNQTPTPAPPTPAKPVGPPLPNLPGVTPAPVVVPPAAIPPAVMPTPSGPIIQLGQGMAVVTTNDPPPLGDLDIRSAPSDSAPLIGGAEKGGTVTVLNWNAGPNYAQISWPGGTRRPAVTGYAHSAYLQAIITTSPTAPNFIGPPPPPPNPAPTVAPAQAIAPADPNQNVDAQNTPEADTASVVDDTSLDTADTSTNDQTS